MIEDPLYEAFHTYDKGDDKTFDYLWSTPIYKRCERGAGYYKYTIKHIGFLPEDHDLDNPKNPIDFSATVTCIIQRNGKKGLQKIFMDLQMKDGRYELSSSTKYLFTSPLDYFLIMEGSKALWARGVKKMSQYQYELHEIKNKYPAHFL